jgi:RimJ/RimL family protein N-acetyltransferase
MLALVLIIGLFGAVVAAMVYDQVRLARRRTIERGFRLVSAQASRRLQFRQPKRADRSFFIEMASDPIAAEANGWRGDEVDAVRERFSNRRLFAKYRGAEMVAFERSTSTSVGTATFATSPLDHENARSIGIHVHPDHRRKGYGREIMAAAITLLQYEPGPVHVGTRVDNSGMQQIMAQLGYEPDLSIRPYTAPDGQSYDGYWYHCGADTHPPVGLYDV